MKKRSKILSVLLAIVMVLSCCVMAFAEDTTDAQGTTTTPVTHTIKITDKQSKMTYDAYQIFTGTVDDAGEIANVQWGNGVDATKVSAFIAKIKADLSGVATVAALDANSTAAEVATALSPIANDSAEAIKLADALETILSSTKYSSATATTDGDGVSTHEITVPETGYYFVKSAKDPMDQGLENYEAATRFILQVVSDEVTVAAKTDTPTIEKKIVENSITGNDKLTDYNQAGLGEEITYQLKARIPSTKDYKHYTFYMTDNMSKGLTFVSIDSVNIVDENGNVLLSDVPYEKSAATIAAGSEYTGGTAFNIKFGPESDRDNIKNSVLSQKGEDGTEIYAGKYVVVTYKAFVNKDAVRGVVGNPNAVKLTYTNNPNVTTGGDVGTPWDEVRTFVTKLVLHKVYKDANGTEHPLAGAVFTLAGTEQFITHHVSYNEDGSVNRVSDTVTPAEAYSVTAKTDANGDIVFDGLAAGTYELREVSAPAGYNLMTPNPVTITIGCTVNDDGEKNIVTQQCEDTLAPSSLQCEWTVNGVTATTAKDDEGNDVLGTFTFTIEDKKGSTLPSTGGMGTTILYIVGAVLLVGAVILLITKKRMAATKEQ